MKASIAGSVTAHACLTATLGSSRLSSARPLRNGHATWREWYLSIGVPEEELGEGDCADRLVDPAEKGPNIWFQGVPEAKSGKNRLHLDLQPTDRTRDEEAERVVALGATVLGDFRRPDGTGWIVLADPEGNEFCLNTSPAERGETG